MEVVPRDVQLALAQSLLTSAAFLLFYSRNFSLLFALLGGALLSLAATAWTPSVLGAVIFSFFLGALPGLFLGFILVVAFDNFHLELTGCAIPYGTVTEEAGTGNDIDVVDEGVLPSRSEAAARAGRFVAALGLALMVIGHVIGIAASNDSMVALAFLNCALSASGAALVALFNRRSAPIRVAWSTLGVISVGGILIVTITINGTNHLGWSTFSLFGYLVFAAATAYIFTTIFSGDARLVANTLFTALSHQPGVGGGGSARGQTSVAQWVAPPPAAASAPYSGAIPPSPPSSGGDVFMKMLNQGH